MVLWQEGNRSHINTHQVVCLCVYACARVCMYVYEALCPSPYYREVRKIFPYLELLVRITCVQYSHTAYPTCDWCNAFMYSSVRVRATSCWYCYCTMCLCINSNRMETSWPNQSSFLFPTSPNSQRTYLQRK